jgi:hypothetical protein
MTLELITFVLKVFMQPKLFRFIMMAYNIIALFKHQVLNSKMQLKTLRAYCFLKESASTGIRKLDYKSC